MDKQQSRSRKQQLIEAVRQGDQGRFEALLTDEFAQKDRPALGAIMDVVIDEDAGWAVQALLSAGMNQADTYAKQAVESEASGVLMALKDTGAEMQPALQAALHNDRTDAAEAILHDPSVTLDRSGSRAYQTGSYLVRNRDPGAIRRLITDAFAETAFCDKLNDEPGSMGYYALSYAIDSGSAGQLRALLLDGGGGVRDVYRDMARHTDEWLDAKKWWREPSPTEYCDEDRARILQKYLQVILQDGSMDGKRRGRYRDAELVTILMQDFTRGELIEALQAGANPYRLLSEHSSVYFTPLGELIAKHRGEKLRMGLSTIMDVGPEPPDRGWSRLYEQALRLGNDDAVQSLLPYEPFKPDVEQLVREYLDDERFDEALELLDSPHVNQAINVELSTLLHHPDERRVIAELFGHLTSERVKTTLRQIAQSNHDELLGQLVSDHDLDDAALGEAVRAGWRNRAGEAVQILVDAVGYAPVLRSVLEAPTASQGRTIEDGYALIEAQLHLIESFIDEFGPPDEPELTGALFERVIELGTLGRDRDYKGRVERSAVQTLRHLEQDFGLEPPSMDQPYKAFLFRAEVFEELFRHLVQYQPPAADLIEVIELGQYRQILRDELNERKRRYLEAQGVDP